MHERGQATLRWCMALMSISFIIAGVLWLVSGVKGLTNQMLEEHGVEIASTEEQVPTQVFNTTIENVENMTVNMQATQPMQEQMVQERNTEPQVDWATLIVAAIIGAVIIVVAGLLFALKVISMKNSQAPGMKDPFYYD